MTFEYVLLEDVNDSSRTRAGSFKLLKGIRGKINLIPFNDWEELELRAAAAGADPRLPDRAARAWHPGDRPVEQGRGHRRRLRTAPRGDGHGMSAR